MREKVKNLIYLDTQRYMSIDNLTAFYWGILIIPFFMIVMGVVSIQVSGVSWKTLFPIVSTIVWSFIYWLFVLIIKSNHVKKTFTLRFIVNGISGLLLSSLFMIFFFSFVFLSDTPFLGVDFIFLVIAFYIIFSLLYIFLIVLCVQKDLFSVIRKKTQTRTFIIISASFGGLIPGAGASGMYISRILRYNAEIEVSDTVMVVLLLVVIFTPILAHINFVQYYYCKKYGITCDEHGDETSPALEPKRNTCGEHGDETSHTSEPKRNTCGEHGDKTSSASESKRNVKPLSIPKKILKIILIVLMGIILFFVLLFLVFFVKTIISKM